MLHFISLHLFLSKEGRVREKEREKLRDRKRPYRERKGERGERKKVQAYSKIQILYIAM